MEGLSDGASSEPVHVAATTAAREGDSASGSQVKVNETVPVLGAGMRTSSDHSFSFLRGWSGTSASPSLSGPEPQSLSKSLRPSPERTNASLSPRNSKVSFHVGFNVCLFIVDFWSCCERKVSSTYGSLLPRKSALRSPFAHTSRTRSCPMPCDEVAWWLEGWCASGVGGIVDVACTSESTSESSSSESAEDSDSEKSTFAVC